MYLIKESVIVRERLGVLLVLGEFLEFLLLVFVGSDLVQDFNQIKRQLTQIHAIIYKCMHVMTYSHVTETHQRPHFSLLYTITTSQSYYHNTRASYSYLGYQNKATSLIRTPLTFSIT